MKTNRLTAIIAMVLVALVMSMPADAQRAKPKAKAKPRPRIETKTTQLQNPAYDMNHACNASDEKLCDFLDRWIADEDFRKSRSSNVKQGSFYDGEINFTEYEIGDFVYQFMVSDVSNKEWSDRFHNPYKKVRKRGTTELDGERCEWEHVDADLAVLTIENWDNVGECGGGQAQYIFQRIDGKWYLIALMMAG